MRDDDPIMCAARRRGRQRARSGPGRVLRRASRQVLRRAEPRARKALVALVCLGAAILVVSNQRGGDTAAPAPATQHLDATSRSTVTGSDPIDQAIEGFARQREYAANQDLYDERTDAPEARWREAHPAYQAVPWRGDGALITIHTTTPGGKIVFAVAYVGTRARAVSAYRRFLELHDDPGRDYQARFLTWEAYRAAVCPDYETCLIPPRP